METSAGRMFHRQTDWNGVKNSVCKCQNMFWWWCQSPPTSTSHGNFSRPWECQQPLTTIIGLTSSLYSPLQQAAENRWNTHGLGSTVDFEQDLKTSRFTWNVFVWVDGWKYILAGSYICSLDLCSQASQTVLPGCLTNESSAEERPPRWPKWLWLCGLHTHQCWLSASWSTLGPIFLTIVTTYSLPTSLIVPQGRASTPHSTLLCPTWKHLC